MADTDSSSSTPEEPVVRHDGGKDKKKKKKTKKHKKKRRREAEDGSVGSIDAHHREESGNGSHDDVDDPPSNMEGSDDKEQPSPLEKKKGKKNKKDKKRKRKAVISIDDYDSDSDQEEKEKDDGSSSCSGSDSVSKKSKKKKHKKSSKKSKDKKCKNQQQQQSHDEMDAKVVSRSAIEYYPEDLKHLQLKKNQKASSSEVDNTTTTTSCKDTSINVTDENDTKKERNVKSSNGKDTDKPNYDNGTSNKNNVTLLLFYQYVEPPWDESQFKNALSFVTSRGEHHGITGRMRVAREGLNCTLTGTSSGIRGWCSDLRAFDGGRSRIDPTTGKTTTEFASTEFKLTDDLPPKQRFPKLHPFEVVELVNYGLAGGRAPKIGEHGGTHLEPGEYHKKMCEEDVVVIDVRNHYEANIGRMVPPVGGAKMIDPMMRKSTEFPMWLDKKETKEMLRGKQVLMYCTGGVRCERASALLKQKIDKEEDTKELGIKGVYQLQGGIDKYFKEFPAGGLWKGKNYTFDKRFAHAPPAVEAAERTKKELGGDNELASSSTGGEGKEVDGIPGSAAEEIMGKCEACLKPWDMYRGKRRCPTCGVPSLICRDCFEADKAGTKKLGREIRCDLCVAGDVRNKRQLKEQEAIETKEYERKLRKQLDDEYEPPTQRKHAITRKPKANPGGITRLFLKNMCAKQMDEAALLESLHPARVTHVQWLLDRNTGKFYGSAFIEVKTPEDAGSVVALDGTFVLGRKIKVKYQEADSKDIWPIANTEVPSS